MLDTRGIEEEDIKCGWYFRIEPFGIKDDECKQIVEQEWTTYTEANILTNLRHCEEKLLVWSKEKFGSIKKRLSYIEKTLKKLRRYPKTEEIMAQRRGLQAEKMDLIWKEENKWSQRSIIDWIQEGDKSTKFFHAKA
ncbi:unnamed protein product [Linum trigynum]|uniref:Uncharacterized protein n=1 Tax=Linum trigynum TaxID=586398 RepID=A0AAV2GQ03_9ROSI